MKTLYLDCFMGAAGDMLSAALLELCGDRESVLDGIRGMDIPTVGFAAEDAVRCGIKGTHLHVTVNGAEEGPHFHEDEAGNVHDHHDHDHDHDHGHHQPHGHDHDYHHGHEHASGHTHGVMHEIEHTVHHLKAPDRVKKDILGVYALLADAESRVHGVPVDQIHFHEVGTMDALADIAAVCYLMDRLAPDEVIASAVRTGKGTVRCAHGVLPVPAPATALLLEDVPVFAGDISSEMCTPTGAALLKYFCRGFGDMPPMRMQKIGYGMGTKEFTVANCVRAVLGEKEGSAGAVVEICCNVDDMTAEEIGFAVTELMAMGALDVYTVPIGMKKNRPGTKICVLADANRLDETAGAVFRLTTTVGIRYAKMDRMVMDRETVTEETPDGSVRIKQCSGYGVTRRKAEYEDLARIARENGISLAEARKRTEE